VQVDVPRRGVVVRRTHPPTVAAGTTVHPSRPPLGPTPARAGGTEQVARTRPTPSDGPRHDARRGVVNASDATTAHQSSRAGPESEWNATQTPWSCQRGNGRLCGVRGSSPRLDPRSTGVVADDRATNPLPGGDPTPGAIPGWQRRKPRPDARQPHTVANPCGGRNCPHDSPGRHRHRAGRRRVTVLPKEYVAPATPAHRRRLVSRRATPH
jgi:hypothetical protein